MTTATASPVSSESTSDAPTVNVAAYLFVTLADLPRRREELQELTQRLDLKGTILLSEEGINLFIAGTRDAVDELLSFLRSDPLLARLTVKESFSDRQPFSRMLVKLKKEIIAFGIDEIDPRKVTAPYLPARQLKQWLDEGRPLTLLDTRNDYEVKVGTFRNSLPIGVDSFRDFPAAVRALPEELKDQPIVTFCTGGIRCEKAAPFMLSEGFREVYQLDGGILKYFEECGGDYYDGDCFVFDQRVALDPQLRETAVEQCFACLAPLTVDDQQSPQYVPGESCPHCYREVDEQQATLLALRHEQLRQATTPLPGSVPYDNFRPINVPERFAGATLIDFLTDRFPNTSRDEWLDLIVAGRVVARAAGGRPAARRRQRAQQNLATEPLDPNRIVREGERFDHLTSANVEPDVNADIRILYEDDSIVVVNKPAPLPMHACGRFNRNSLQSILDTVYAPQRLRAAHRLDAATSGVVLHSRSRSVARQVQPQFEQRRVVKIYIARVAGHPDEDEFVCDAPIAASTQPGGLRNTDQNGLHAETRFRVLQRCDDGSSLVEVRPITGRTNQIRIHLWSLGLPVCGDSYYLPDRALGTNDTPDVDAKPLCLHARSLTFEHSDTGETLTFEAPLPEWARD
ncbi:sulfurtransferase [bacterium]|nr:sulfurtransferase [bacterium]